MKRTLISLDPKGVKFEIMRNKLSRNTLIFGIIMTVSSTASLLAQTPIPTEGQTIINGRILTEEQKSAFQLAYGSRPFSGSFWYDARSGMVGYWGREVGTLIVPGLNLGPLSHQTPRTVTQVFLSMGESSTPSN